MENANVEPRTMSASGEATCAMLEMGDARACGSFQPVKSTAKPKKDETMYGFLMMFTAISRAFGFPVW